MEKITFTIEQARKHRGFTQEEMAKVLGMSTRSYIDYENYKRSLRIDKAALFSKVVNISIDSIIFFESELHFKCRDSVIALNSY